MSAAKAFVWISLLAVVAGASALGAQSAPRRETVALVPELGLGENATGDLTWHSIGLQLEAAHWDRVAFWLAGNRLNYDQGCALLYSCYGKGSNVEVGVHLRPRGSARGLSPYLGSGFGYTRFDEPISGRRTNGVLRNAELPFFAVAGIGWRNARYVTPRLELRAELGQVKRDGTLVIAFAIGFPRPPLPDSSTAGRPVGR